MKKKNLIPSKLLKFKKWENSAWSIFKSIGKQIMISVLPISYLTFSFLNLNAQTDTIEIDDIQVVSSRIPISNFESSRVIYTIDKDEIEKLPIHSLQDLIEYASNIDVRQRGAEGIQADISIRGGNFEQTLILLNGFKMNDAQTGHHNLDLPVDIESIEKVEIIEGPGNRFFGINAYSGAINFITNTQTANKLKLSIFAGQHKYFGGSASISLNHKNWKNYLSVSKKTSAGYLPNDTINNTDFNTLSIFYETEIKTKLSDFKIQAGYLDKSFGANSFYTPKFPWQYENTKTIFAAYKAIKKGKNYKFTKSFYWKRHQDRFELFRESKYKRNNKYFVDNQDTAKYYPNIYADWNYYKEHNYHKTNLISSILKYDFKNFAGRTAIGAEYRHVFIKSNVLGDDMETPIDVPFEDFGEYTKKGDRYNINMFLEHLYKYEKLNFSIGGAANYNSDYNWNYTGGIDASYSFNKKLKLFASANKAIRLPTYTELYYNGPSNKGNPNLLPENALTYEIGSKYRNRKLKANLSFFKRYGQNTIDWVRISDTIDWQAQNITDLITNGVEFSASYYFGKNKFVKKASFSYAYMDVDKQSGKYISKYELDYLKHKVVFSLHHRIYKNIAANWIYQFEDRNGSFSEYNLKTKEYLSEKEYSPISLINLKIFWSNDFIEVFSEVSNLLNTEYYEFGNIKMPGRWIKIGAKINLNL